MQENTIQVQNWKLRENITQVREKCTGTDLRRTESHFSVSFFNQSVSLKSCLTALKMESRSL